MNIDNNKQSMRVVRSDSSDTNDIESKAAYFQGFDEQPSVRKRIQREPVESPLVSKSVQEKFDYLDVPAFIRKGAN